MVNFDFLKSESYRIWKFKSNFAQTFIILTIVSVALLIVAFLLMFQDTAIFAGLGQILLGLVLLAESCLIAARFAEHKLQSTNLADKFAPDLIELFDKILETARNEGVTEINPDYFFEKSALSFEGRVIFIRFGLFLPDVHQVGRRIANPAISLDFTNLLAGFSTLPHLIEVEDLLEVVVLNSPSIKKFLSDNKVEEKDFNIVLSLIRRIKQESKTPKFWQEAFQIAGIGEEWSYGYTPILSQYSTDLSRYFQDPNINIDIYSHSNIVNDMQSILAKPAKNNCLLVGDPGVGKKTIVNALAAKLAHGDCLGPLKYKRIRQINTARLIGGGTTNELVSRISSALSEAVNAGNIIIYIDNFQSLIGGGAATGGEVGGIDASQVLLPFLENSSLRIIASVTPDDYFARIKNNPAVAGSFGKVDVAPANPDDTLSILLDYIDSVESRYNTFFIFQTLKKVVELSDRYIHDIPFPEKALRLVEEVAIRNGGKGKLALITPEDIEAFISQKVNIPVGQADEVEKTKLLNLENFLHARVVGQNEAVNAVSDSLRRVRAGLTSGKRPVGVFLFLGPTGVGKTETAKALAESYFGSEKNMIRLDMSEYQQPDSVNRLLGSPANPSGVLTDAISANPFSLVLLDEIEKADRNVLNVFLQVFEDGRLTDARGRVSDFTNAIIIATSNAGSEFIRENLGTMNSEMLKENLVNKLQQDGQFTPEFLNRFDGVIVYRPLTQPELEKVAVLMINSINQNLAEKKIKVDIAPDALVRLVELGNDPQFGARPMRRVIQQKVENLLAKKMLEGTVTEGQTLTISVTDLG